MLDFVTAGSNLPFTVALAMMLILAALEVLGFLFGLSQNMRHTVGIPADYGF